MQIMRFCIISKHPIPPNFMICQKIIVVVEKIGPRGVSFCLDL
jgi:hypothetical protein